LKVFGINKMKEAGGHAIDAALQGISESRYFIS